MRDTVYLPASLRCLEIFERMWEDALYPIPVEFIETDLFGVITQNSRVVQAWLKEWGRPDLIRPLVYKHWEYRLIHNAPGEDI